MPKVSVIIPVYNTERYIKECLDSVVNQTLKDIEIILIDNGSTDSSLQILKKYAKDDKRIIVIENKINLTAGEARNQGLEVATGEYLSFLDSDDYFELDMLEIAYSTCKKNQTDIGVFGAENFDTATRKIISKTRLPYFFRNKFDLDKIKTLECKDWLFNMFIPAAWNKLFKTSFIKENDIKFQEIVAANDVAFTSLALFYSDSFSYIDKSFVHYRQNHSTCISEYRNKNAIFCYEAFSFTQNRLESEDRFIHFSNSFFRFLIQNLYQALKSTTKEDFDKVKEKNMRLFESKDSTFNNFFYNNIVKLDYNEFIQDDFAKEFYKVNYENAINFIRKNAGKSVALWGAGRNGKAFLDVFEDKIDIKYVIDNATEKQNLNIRGKEIVSFDKIKNFVDTIIVTNERFYEEIVRQVNLYAKDIAVLDLDTYLRFEILEK